MPREGQIFGKGWLGHTQRIDATGDLCKYNCETNRWNLLPLTPNVWTYLDFGDIEAHTAVHSMESDGIELTLVQIDHGHLIGLVR